MVSCAFLSILLLCITASRVAADFIDNLPDCWQDCVEQNTDPGCNTPRCICRISSTTSFLPNVTKCLRSDCDMQSWKVDTLLLAFQPYCKSVGYELPSYIINSVHDAATQLPTLAPPLAPQTSTRLGNHGTLTQGLGDSGPTSTSTVTHTTTNEAGETLLVYIPVLLGPSTTAYGPTSTSTLQPSGTTASTPSSMAAPSSSTPNSTGVTSISSGNNNPQATTESSTTTSSSSKKPEKTVGNGSPFENTPGGAERWGVQSWLLATAVFLGGLLGL